MRILMQQGAYFPWVGGAEIFMQKLAEHMVAGGHHVDVVTGLWSKPDIYTENWNKEFEVINGVNVYRVPTAARKYAGALSCIWQTVLKSKQLDRASSYDVIHSHISPALICGAASKGKNRLMITLQGGDFGEYKESKMALRVMEAPFIVWALRRADLVHAVSTHIARQAGRYGARKIRIVPNGVDARLFRPNEKNKARQKLGYRVDQRIVISSSRLTPKNGLEYLVRAVARIPNLSLLIIGDGEQRSYLEALIAELNLRGRVELLGYLEHTRLPDYLNMADVFCRPSIDEGFGIAFIEAMACRIPTIGTAVGGITDIIEDGRNGLLVAPGSSDDVLRALKKVLHDKELARRIAGEGYLTVQKKFTWPAVLERMDSLYGELVQQPGGRK